jgi:hypothetical protein
MKGVKNLMVIGVVLVFAVIFYQNGNAMVFSGNESSTVIPATEPLFTVSSDEETEPATKIKPFVLGEDDKECPIDGYSTTFRVENLQKLKTIIETFGPVYVPLKKENIIKVTKIEPVKFLGLFPTGYTVHYIDNKGNLQEMSGKEFKTLWKDNAFFYGPAATGFSLAFSEDADQEKVKEFANKANEILGEFSELDSEIPSILQAKATYNPDTENIDITLITKDIDTLKDTYKQVIDKVSSSAKEEMGSSYLGIRSSDFCSILQRILEKYLDKDELFRILSIS